MKIKNEERIKAVIVYIRDILLKFIYSKNILNIMQKSQPHNFNIFKFNKIIVIIVSCFKMLTAMVC